MSIEVTSIESKIAYAINNAKIEGLGDEQFEVLVNPGEGIVLIERNPGPSGSDMSFRFTKNDMEFTVRIDYELTASSKGPKEKFEVTKPPNLPERLKAQEVAMFNDGLKIISALKPIVNEQFFKKLPKSKIVDSF